MLEYCGALSGRFRFGKSPGLDWIGGMEVQFGALSDSSIPTYPSGHHGERESKNLGKASDVPELLLKYRGWTCVARVVVMMEAERIGKWMEMFHCSDGSISLSMSMFGLLSRACHLCAPNS